MEMSSTIGRQLLLNRWSKEIRTYENGEFLYTACQHILEGTANFQEQEAYADIMDIWTELECLYRELINRYPPTLALEMCSLIFKYRQN